MKTDKLFRLGTYLLFILALFVPLWLLFSNFITNVTPFKIVSPAVIALLIISIFTLNKYSKLPLVLNKINYTIQKHFLFILASILFISVAIRFGIYQVYSYSPVHDPSTFYYSAQQIANGGGMIGDQYVAFFPYIAAYNNLLGFFVKLISDPWLSTIILNTLFDVLSSIFIFYIIFRITKQNTIIATIAFAFWILSPFNIIFSVLSLPIVVVNSFIIFSLFLSYMLIGSVEKNKPVTLTIYSATTGLVVGIGNCFRPVFSIVLIGIFIIYFYLFYRHGIGRVPVLVWSFSIIVLVYILLQVVNLGIIAHETKLKPATNASGWSFYVGSNIESGGTWNENDEIKKAEICVAEIIPDDCHKKLQEAGISRYKEYGPVDSVLLLIKKLHTFSADQTNLYNADQSISGYKNSLLAKAMYVYINLYIFILYILCSLFYYYNLRKYSKDYHNSPIVIFITLILVGLFYSSVIFEVSHRYSQIIYPMLVLVSSISIGLVASNLLKRNNLP